ncbi:MAG: hypothetical protein PHP02_02565, partial [Eubacteriales bacterium]|nr:hypothetical protein [Eubacteriales bacterium]
KIAIVYLHGKGNFEVWLSARNREISKQYESVFCGKSFDGITVFHDDHNQDAIVECTLISSPNFEDPVILTDMIEQGIQAFLTVISNLFT